MFDTDKMAEQVVLPRRELQCILERIEYLENNIVMDQFGVLTGSDTSDESDESDESDVIRLVDKQNKDGEKLLSAINAVNAKVNVLTRWMEEYEERQKRLILTIC